MTVIFSLIYFRFNYTTRHTLMSSVICSPPLFQLKLPGAPHSDRVDSIVITIKRV